MPKETLHRDVYFNESEDAPGTGTACITTLSLHWDDARGVELVASYEERPATRTSPDHEIVLGESPLIGEGSPANRYIYVHPDRRELNGFVRAARRARDQVFGADE